MKYMVISDIHGGISELNNVLNIYLKEKCSKLLILGDLFNYGIDLNRDDVINRLNYMKQNIIAVRGNCDNNINGITFDMPYINQVSLNGKKLFLTHGHLYNVEYLTKLDSDIILLGHSHRPQIDLINDTLFINPGSISKSRDEENTFIIIDDKEIILYNLEGNIIEKHKL